MTYNFEIMKKVVTLQNGIGLWSQKLVLKPKAFCKSPKCQKPLLFVKVFRVPAFCTYNKGGATSHGQFYRGSLNHFSRIFQMGVQINHPFFIGFFPTKLSSYWATPMAIDTPRSSTENHGNTASRGASRMAEAGIEVINIR